MSKERMTGDATGWQRGARGIDGVGKPLAPFKRISVRKPKVKKLNVRKGYR